MEPELIATLLQGETERVEWKESLASGDKIVCSIAALANDLGDTRSPGYLVVGVDDEGRAVGVGSGIKAIDEVQKKVSDYLASSKIVPAPPVNLTPVNVGDATVLVVAVAPYAVPPAVAVDQVVWVRVGPTTRRAKDVDLVRLRERRPENQRPFDSRIERTGTLDHLRLDDLRNEYAAAMDDDADAATFPTFERWLTQRQLGQIDEGVWRPTACALLVYGKAPQEFYPGAIVEFVRFDGTDVDARVLDRRTIVGTLPEQLDVLWTQLNTHIVDVAAVEPSNSILERYAPTYPLEALKELARNLVQHRQYEATRAPGRVEWYDDRIEFKNPGGPFGQASEGAFGEHSDYRNPSVTQELVHLGYVQRLGRGLRRVAIQLAKNGNPPLHEETDGFTSVTVRRR